MPYSEPDPTDPHSLVGVSLPTSEDCDLDMAYVIAEEFARLGFDEKRLLNLFQDPFYRSANRVFQSLGEERIKTIIREGVRIWGRSQVIEREDSGEDPLVQLGIPEREEKRGK